MPLYLPPLTRRQFLTHTLAGGVAVLTAGRLPAAEAVEEERWALLSDVHIAADPAAVNREVCMADHLRAVVGQIAGQAHRPAHFIINGDLSLDHGEPGDYGQLVELLKPVREKGVPVHLTLGNHDERDVFWQGVPEQATATPPVAGKHLSVLETPLANWFLLDSLEVTKATPGTLGEAQLAWLTAALDARPGKPAIVMVHHQPNVRVLPPGKKFSGLLDGEALLAVLKPRRQVKALFFGHTHVWSTAEQEGLHLVNLPAVAYVFSPEETSAWVEGFLRRDGMRLEVRALDAGHPRAGTVVDLRWRG